jgi:hypothetical protein
MGKEARVIMSAGFVKWVCMWTHVLRNATLSRTVRLNINFVNNVYSVNGLEKVYTDLPK